MPVSAIVTVGNEILLGKTLNTNLAYLAGELALLGLPVEFSLTVKDEPEAIKNAWEQAWNQADVVITTGGLGPTDDDITKKTIADFFGVELVFRDELWQHVQSLFAARKQPTPEINRCQALVPAGFTALRNDRGTAPGLFYRQGDKCFLAFAGVPLEMKYVFDTQAKPALIDVYGSAGAITQRTLHTFGISESALAEILISVAVPANVNFAWLPQTGRVDLRFYGTDKEAIAAMEAACYPLIAEYVWGVDDDTPVSVLHSLLRAKQTTLAAAESCTGGLVQKMLTDPAGASDIFIGGAVTYSNNLKKSLLHVTDSTLEHDGAVSENCAREMSRGIKTLTNSDWGISLTGIAGPDGGSAEKPVGTVCFGFSFLDRDWSLRQVFTGDRDSIRWKAAEFCILNLIKYLRGMAG